MATDSKIPLPALGSIEVRVDRIYGNLTVYPVCERAQLLAAIAGTKTMTHETLCLAERLGFEIVTAEAAKLFPEAAEAVRRAR